MTTVAAPFTTTVEKIPAGSLKVDPRVQRTLVGARVNRMVQEINLDGLGTLAVSRRADGDYIIDGQHRHAALMAADFGDWECDCKVHHGLSLAQEAGLFRVLNQTKVVGVFDDFTKGVIEGDPECVAINTIVSEAGLRVAHLPSAGCVAAVRKLRDLYAKNGGAQALVATLAVITQAWGQDRDGLDGRVITGIGTVLLRYGGEVELGVLARKLAKRHGGPLVLIGDARGLSDLRGGTVSRAMAEIIVGEYNRGRRSNRLGPL